MPRSRDSMKAPPDLHNVMIRWLVILLLPLMLAAPYSWGADAAVSKRFTLDHLNQLVRLSEPQVSPDGKSAALIVQRAEPETNRWVAELLLVDTATGEKRSLTAERQVVRHPRWSPTGDRLAFLSSHG